MSHSHYDILGLNKNASKDEINKKYVELVKKWHPDKCSDKITAQNKLIKINKAYQILTDDIERKQYDTEIKQNNYDIFLKLFETEGQSHSNYSNCISDNTSSSLNSTFSLFSESDSPMDIHKFRKTFEEITIEMSQNEIYHKKKHPKNIKYKNVKSEK